MVKAEIHVEEWEKIILQDTVVDLSFVCDRARFVYWIKQNGSLLEV